MRRLLMFTMLAVLAATLVPTDRADAGAMDSVTWYGAANLAVPFGDWSDFAGLGFGAAVGARMPHNDQLTFRGEVGYTKFGGKDVEIGAAEWSYSYSMIPILALCEFVMDPASPLYLVGGLGFIHRSIDIETSGTSMFDISGSSSDMEIGIVAGGGFRASEKIDVEARLNLVSDSSSLTAQGVFHF